MMTDVSKTPDFVSLFPEQRFQRRAFLVTSIGAGFAMAVQPVSAQTISTDTSGLVAGEVKVPVKDGQMPAYRAMPAAGGPFATVLVAHEAWAVHEHI
jgi:carboxymethylenebutenolidase